MKAIYIAVISSFISGIGVAIALGVYRSLNPITFFLGVCIFAVGIGITVGQLFEIHQIEKLNKILRKDIK